MDVQQNSEGKTKLSVLKMMRVPKAKGVRLAKVDPMGLTRTAEAAVE
jgi:hypothetical protein